MKTFTLDVGYFDGDPILMEAKKLEAYPDTFRGVLEVKYEKLTAGIVLAADAALNRKRDLFQESFDGSLKAGVSEGFGYARAVEIIIKTVKEMTFRTNSGDLMSALSEVTEDAVKNLSPAIVTAVASRIEYPVIPTPEEVKAQGEG